MRLHRLKVTAFGPFSGSEEIDFTALGEAGLFLINGPTGAGKTSVLDAVCFALYGQVPGARNNAKQLRSDHAAAGQGPSVELETSIRGRRFRVTRSPQWERPKLRGSGTKLEQAHVLVEELTGGEPTGGDGSGGEWTFLTNRLDEAGDLVLRLLGMNAAQFCQVAMLPQGDFAAFLRASAEERRRVLEKLFATEIYAAVEKWLADRRAATRLAAEQLEGLVERTADKISEATGAVRPAGALLPWAKELRGDLDAVLAVAADLLGESERAFAAVRTAWAEGRELA
ncbi:SMC family ATPase, partial [Actinocorallia longicatena]|uniref:SMC family ATPase n=1 Tax=Actinocorallia longicatena TaxID=111803 RepID=UPI0031D56D9D